jgi:hypothetical protein
MDDDVPGPLEWKQQGRHYVAQDTRVMFYRVMPMFFKGKITGWRALMNGMRVGDKFRSPQEAIDYVEYGGEPPRRSE